MTPLLVLTPGTQHTICWLTPRRLIEEIRCTQDWMSLLRLYVFKQHTNSYHCKLVFFFFSFSYTPAKIVWYLWNSIEHHRRNSGSQPHIDPVSSKMRRLNKEIRYSMEGGAFWCYGNIKLQENIRELAMQYLTVQYLLAMESLKLLIMNLNILVAVTSNFFNPCRYEAFEI